MIGSLSWTRIPAERSESALPIDSTRLRTNTLAGHPEAPDECSGYGIVEDAGIEDDDAPSENLGRLVELAIDHVPLAVRWSLNTQSVRQVCR